MKLRPKGMKKAELFVFKAALACVHRKGWAYLCDRRDADYVKINEPAFQRLERAVAAYREVKKRMRK